MTPKRWLAEAKRIPIDDVASALSTPRLGGRLVCPACRKVHHGEQGRAGTVNPTPGDHRWRCFRESCDGKGTAVDFVAWSLLSGLPGGRDDWSELRRWFGRYLAIDDDGTGTAPSRLVLTAPQAPPVQVPNDVAITMWRDLRDTAGTITSVSWSSVCARVVEPRSYQDKHSTPLWTWAWMPDGRTRSASPPALRDVSALVLDYDDDPTVTPAALVNRWGRWTFVAHTTASHGIPKRGKPALPRWRVIIPLRDVLPWDDFESVATWASKRDAGLSDEHGHRGRMWHLPAAGDEYQHVIHAGQMLSLPGIIKSMCDTTEARKVQGKPDVTKTATP